jgi:hypothetical protein
LTAFLLNAHLAPVPRRWAAAMVSLYALAALGLSLVGDDYRRWWGFAFVTMVASLVLLRQGAAPIPAPRRPEGPPGRRLVAVALLASAALALFPIWPTWDQPATGASIDRIQPD